jgi:hypothetical protein
LTEKNEKNSHFDTYFERKIVYIDDLSLKSYVFSHFKMRKTVFGQPAWQGKGLKKQAKVIKTTASLYKNAMRAGI